MSNSSQKQQYLMVDVRNNRHCGNSLELRYFDEHLQSPEEFNRTATRNAFKFVAFMRAQNCYYDLFSAWPPCLKQIRNQ